MGELSCEKLCFCGADDDRVVTRVDRRQRQVCIRDGWISVGTSSRTFIGALLCGLADFVEVIVADPTQSQLTINGLRRLSMEGSVLVCAAGLSSFPTLSLIHF